MNEFLQIAKVNTKKARGLPERIFVDGAPGMVTGVTLFNYLAVESTTTFAAESAGMATVAGSAIVSAGAATSAGFA